MSAKLTGQVWDLQLPRMEIMILLAMADHAHHDGTHVFPSQALIAWKTGYSIRQIRRVQDELKRRKILIPEGAGYRGLQHYRLDFSQVPIKPPFVTRDSMSSEDKMSSVKKPHVNKLLHNTKVKMSAEEPSTEDKMTAVKMSSEDILDSTTDIFDTSHYKDARAEPSLEPLEAKETPPEIANAISTPQGGYEDAPQWMRKWKSSKRFPADFPHSPPSWFLTYCAEHMPHVDVAHEWEYMLDHTFRSTRTQFFMVARRWMETAEENRRANSKGVVSSSLSATDRTTAHNLSARDAFLKRRQEESHAG